MTIRSLLLPGVLIGFGYCLLFDSVARAQDPQSGQEEAIESLQASISQSIRGNVVKSRLAGIPLRNSAPSFLGLYGRETDTTKQDAQFLVLDAEHVPRFLTKDRWIKLTPISPDGKIDATVFHWAYWGEEAKQSSNFSVVEASEVSDELKQMIARIRDGSE